MKRHVLVVACLCLLVCAAARAADVPPPCHASRAPDRIINTRFTIDFTHPLPIPDYVDTVVACTSFPQPPSPPPAPRSAWIESERALYADVLARHPVDLLIVPFQTQGYGLDRIERALLTSELAYAIGDASDLKIADPFLVARAFGEGTRRIAPSDVVDLARKVGATRVITGYIGHDRNHAFTLTLQAQNLSAPAGKQTVWQRDWRAVPFTDQRTPAVVFNDMLADILRTLPLKLTASQAPAAVPSVALPVIGQGPRELATAFNGQGPTATAAAFDLLGALAPLHSELARERAFERALIVSARAGRADPSAQFLKAYSLMQLWRRPGALAALEGQTSPESLALVDLLNGDLPSAQKSVARVPQSVPRLLLDTALRDLEAAYERKLQARPTASKQAFGPASATWAPFVELRSMSSEHWSVVDPVVIKALLDRTFPVPELAARRVLVGNAVGEIDVDLANERHVRRIATQTEPDVCCKTAALRPAPWDVLWLFEGLADESIRRNLLRQIEFQGVPAEAMADIRRYEPLLIGQPVLEAARSEAAGQIAGKSTDDTNANWVAQADQAAAVAGYFSPGQNLITLVGGGNEAYDYDYPRRPFWKSFPGGRMDGEFQQNHIAGALEGLAFSTSDLSWLAGLQYGNAPPAQLTAVIASLGTRFNGNPGKPLGNPASAGDSADKLAQLEAALKADPASWQRYDALGRYLISSGGSYSVVRDAFLKYPGFKDPHPDDPVGLSNNAADAGALLLNQGQPQLAQPFFGIAARLETGSYSSLWSAAMLQVMRGDYVSATAAYLDLTRRYDDSSGYEEYFSLLHAFNRSKEAWAAFSRVKASSIDPEVWISALVAHNREGLDENKVRAWLLRPENRDAHFRGVRFASYYAILWSSTDHMPPADLGKLVEQLDGGLTSRAYLDSTLVPSIMAPDGFEGALQSKFRPRKSPGPLEQVPIRSQLAYFADAYAAVRLGDYESAVARFVEMADHYRVEDYPLAYFAYAAAKTGDKEHLEKYIQTRELPYPEFDSWLAKAFFAASRHDTDEALKNLHNAFRTRFAIRGRPILSTYEYAQACEWLFRDTGDTRFKGELLDWVRKRQMISPAQSWAYTMQYTYEKPGPERTRALAMARYLDPASPRIQKASKAELEAAQDWLREHNPFRIPERNPNSPEKIARNDGS